ncbi:MAG: tetratricopeptide repeat protein [Chloroflexi bacterium]|nr:tetratricopeptide repeat protein [Chloroflexota bacterium]
MADQDLFGEWLKRRRKSLDLTREELAQRAHCSASAVRRLEAGELRPSKALAESLAAALHIPAEEQEAFVRFARGGSSQPSITSPGSTQTRTPPSSLPSPQSSVLSPQSSALIYLPAPLTSFVGRKREVTAVCELLAEEGVRLLTLTGPPGVGKTRLSIAAAGRLAETGAFADGLYFVPLAPIRDPNLVVSAVAQLLGVREAAGDNSQEYPVQQALKAFLRSKRLLLVLDNFEQVTAAAPFVTDWLAAAPGVKALVTSRAVLHVYGEHEFPVPPLALPDVNRLPTALASSFYARYPAVQLFKERARAVQHEFHVTAENAADVAHICAWLDGLPLAIEMAAAQVKWLPPHRILEQLSNRLSALTGGPRDLSPRQQSLNGAIKWSYNLLDSQQQRLFNLLGVFVGGCDLEAVQAVVEKLEMREWRLADKQSLISNLQSLIEKSLLRYEMTPEGEARYEMLETLRDYARQQLAAGSALEQARQAHAAYYFRLAQTASTHLLRGGDQAIWLRRLEQDHNNLRATLAWATETPGQAAFALELAQAMLDFWDTRGYIREGRHWLETVLAMDGTPTRLRGHLLNDAGWLARLQGDREAARAFQEQALAIQKLLGDEMGMSRSLENLAILASSQGDTVQASTLLEQSLIIRRRLGDPAKLLPTLNNLAVVAWQLKEFGRAEQLYRELAELSRAIENVKALGSALHGLGTVYVAQGDHAAALTSFRETLAIRQELGDRPGVVNSLGGAAEALFYLGDVVSAVRLMRASLKLQEELGKVTSPAAGLEDEAKIALMRSRAGEEAFARAWAEGEAMSVEEAVALAIGQ